MDDLDVPEVVEGDLSYNAIVNGVRDLSKLDGYADLERGQATMRVYCDGEFEIEYGAQV